MEGESGVVNFTGPVVSSSDSGGKPDNTHTGTFTVKPFDLSFPSNISGAVRDRYSVLRVLTFIWLGGKYSTKLSPMYEVAGKTSTDFNDI